MTQPAYIRSGSESTFPSASDDASRRNSIEVAGLREKPLVALVVCLGFLAFLAVFLLIMNIMIILSLQMDHHGMKFLRFHTILDKKTGEIEKVVEFNGNDIDLGTVITNGQVVGYHEGNIEISGSRLLISGEEDSARFILQDNSCKYQNIDEFQVLMTSTNRTIFSAQNPLITIDERIKKISTSKIITNKIRAPIDEDLNISVENLSIRGNEGIRMESRSNEISASTQIALNTSRDGAIRFSGQVVFGSSAKSLPLSPSPALAASIDAFRVCVCHGSKPRLYLTPGNKPCIASTDICG
ncbi:unnamed protein product [Auanema sp. JU1783]|nr:unnamed protein product [Auanema sp. JU1783]